MTHMAPLARTPGLLRFITCGSVDDGKSTLIGRLLADTGNIPTDQVAALAADSRRFGTQAGGVDYALLLDGLAAEREQGITIDVAHRYFATARRSFIVADTPGHRQYTRNMATGASRADLAVILVDARHGIVEQTRRHTLIVALLGVREIVLAVNKMDLVGFRQDAFDAIEAGFRAFTAGLDGPAPRVTAIPLSARDGDNLTLPSPRIPWYSGPTLLEHLEHVDATQGDASQADDSQADDSQALAPLRLPVQMTLRPDATFRGCAGTIAWGSARVGDAVAILPGGRTTRIAAITTPRGERDGAETGAAVTVVLDDAVDVSRGDMIVAAEARPHVADRLEARLLWSAERPLDPAREYLVKLGTATAHVRLDAPTHGLDVDTGRRVPVDGLGQNAIADTVLRLDRPLAFDTYAENRMTGGLILVDRETNETVAMGTVSRLPPPAAAALPTAREHAWRSVAKAVSWRVVGSLDTFGLAWLFTHQVSLAAGISATEVVTKLALYYGHERTWARIGFGVRRQS